MYVKWRIGTEPDPYGGRSWCAALGVSTLLHLGVIVLLASLAIELGYRSDDGVETRWTPQDERVVPARLDSPPPLTVEMSLLPGGERSVTGIIEQPRPLDVPPPRHVEAELLPDAESVLLAPDLADDVGRLLAIGHENGSGEAGGEGDGSGEGKGFFGINHRGRRFVYVVDCSGSMNRPHDSPSKTRFRRVKLELVKSVGLMEPTHEFFIIFFNDDPLPMPARGLQPANSRTKQRYLEWAADVSAVGNTDPRGAISLALRLAPDAIYFLTDGSFDYRTRRYLAKISQQQIAIHTFAMGNRDGEATLREIAEHNGGQFHFVP